MAYMAKCLVNPLTFTQPVKMAILREEFVDYNDWIVDVRRHR